MQLLGDFIRYAIFSLAGVGVGFMLMTNVIAFMVLRPPKRLGFLWWHVTSISLSVIMIGAVAMENITTRLSTPITWRALLMLSGTALYAVAQLIIFKVERSRLIDKRTAEIIARAV